MAAGLFSEARADLENWRLDAAQDKFLRLLATKPAAPLAALLYVQLAFVATKQGRVAATEESYRQALILDPTQPDALNNLAVLLQSQQRRDEACALYQRLVTGPAQDSATVWSNFGALLREQKRFQDSQQALDRALALDPAHANALINHAHLLFERQRPDEAEVACRRALDVAPGTAAVQINLGVLLAARGAVDEAEDLFRRVLSAQPDHAEALSNLGALLTERNRMDEAESLLQKACARAPESAAAHYNYALYLLTQGHLAEGWAELEWRYRPGMVNPAAPKPPDFTIPMWRGEALDGKTILVLTEQAFGDEILFVRYAQFLKQRGGRVIWATRPPLAALMRTVPWIDQLILLDEAPVAALQADFWVFPLSLPFLAHTTLDNIPAPLPVFTPDPEKKAHWQTRLGTVAGKKRLVGLIGTGKPVPPGRSIPFRDLCDTLGKPLDTLFVSLQMGPEALADLDAVNAARPDHPVYDAGSQVLDFSDTAAVLSLLDLLITIDSAPAHLAGSLGIPVWTLLKYVPDWRWFMGRNDTPWYPHMRLFRQETPGDWSTPLTALSHAFQSFLDQESLPPT